MNIVYLIFGNQQEIHQQANFSITTAFANGGNFGKIIVITDAPEYYVHLKSDTLVVETISLETIQEWRGIHNYVFRAKIKAIAYIIHKYPNDDLLYLDADTCILTDLSELKKKLSNGYYCMHLNEGRIVESTRNTQKSIWKVISNQTFSGIKIKPQLCMWNAGVIGIPVQNNQAYINQVLSINDEIYETNIRKKLVEQLAFSILLQQQNYAIESHKEIKHYWGNKKAWNAKITSFFLSNHLKNLNFKQSVTRIADFDLEELPVLVKVSKIKIRLNQIIDKFF